MQITTAASRAWGRDLHSFPARRFFAAKKSNSLTLVQSIIDYLYATQGEILACTANFF